MCLLTRVYGKSTIHCNASLHTHTHTHTHTHKQTNTLYEVATRLYIERAGGQVTYVTNLVTIKNILLQIQFRQLTNHSA